jgi:hypothetical protein
MHNSKTKKQLDAVVSNTDKYLLFKQINNELEIKLATYIIPPQQKNVTKSQKDETKSFIQNHTTNFREFNGILILKDFESKTMHSYEYVNGIYKPLPNQRSSIKQNNSGIKTLDRVECTLTYVDCLWYGMHYGGCWENGYFETGRSTACYPPFDFELVDYSAYFNQTIYFGYVNWSLIHVNEYYDCIIYEDPPPTPDPPVESDPCLELKNQNQDPNYESKINELNGKTSLKKETGYAETKSGTYNPLIPGASTSDSDNLNININTETKGFVHTHLDDYESGKIYDNGTIEIKKPIKMFSPADVNALMELANVNSGSGDYSEYYVTMVSSYGNYTIKFNGNNSDIQTGFDTPVWRLKYKKYYENESGSDEKKFLRFMKEEMRINGVELFKVKNNGIIEEKTLGVNSNGKSVVISNPCPQ